MCTNAVTCNAAQKIGSWVWDIGSCLHRRDWLCLPLTLFGCILHANLKAQCYSYFFKHMYMQKDWGQGVVWCGSLLWLPYISADSVGSALKCLVRVWWRTSGEGRPSCVMSLTALHIMVEFLVPCDSVRLNLPVKEVTADMFWLYIMWATLCQRQHFSENINSVFWKMVCD